MTSDPLSKRGYLLPKVNMQYSAHSAIVPNALTQAGIVDVSEQFIKNPWRRICACPEFERQWELLLTIRVSRGQASALAQAVDEIEFFCTGNAYRNPVDTHPLDPIQKHCWALKTPDVRIYGWFAAINVFVAHSIGDANKSHGRKGHQVVTSIVHDIASFRDSLPKAAQKHVIGSTLRDVFTNRIR